MMRRLTRGILTAAVFVGVFPVFAAAQTNDEVFPQVQWNFSTPGARANGMGRAFIGVADDASATITNPAGLMSLTRPQVYLEYKNTNISVDRLANTDAFKTLQPTTFTSTVNALSFANFSIPIGSKLAAGFTVHQFLFYREVLSLAPRPIVNSAGNFLDFVTFALDGDVDFKGQSFAGTVSYAATKQLMVGATFSLNQLSAKSTGTRYRTIFGPTYNSNRTDVRRSGIIANQTSIDSSDTKPGVEVGALFKPNEKVSAGFMYARSPKFTVNERFIGNPSATVNLPLVPITGFADPTPLPINVPDRFAFGIAAHPQPKLLVAFDVVRIMYSSLAKNSIITLNVGDPSIQPSMFSIDDGTEVHVGGEYQILGGSNPVFVRAGVFTNPNHTTRFSSSPDPTLNVYYNNVYNLLPRDMAVRGTVGAGVALGPRLQLDAAYVHRKEFVASTAVRF